ncbi:MAG: M28 family peptidase [Kordiimonadaceae bacterium]|jgi:Zn-dependent M28 family amino/carboxypeptidase|nr:M28 family peptidase [Kordiimonadaceae bacterium]
MKNILIAVSCVLAITVGNINLIAQENNYGVSSDRIKENVRTLSSDYFEGRAPSTMGETKTINYIKDKLQDMGVQPGNGDSYFQGVELVNIKATSSDTQIEYEAGGEVFIAGNDIAITTKSVEERISVSGSEIVFVGYGAIAPEYGWNDYEGLDVKGKTVLILDRDPGQMADDDTMFKGQGVTYYARSSYKYEEAKRQGAAMALIIHDKDFTGAPWQRIQAFTSRAALSLDPDKVPSQNLDMQGRIPKPSVEKLFEKAGMNFEQEKAKALVKGFKGYSLNSSISVSLDVDVVRSTSQNVIGIIPGTERPDEYVFYLAHWDHLGTDKSLTGDQIYNGARDNASGIAGILEIAQAHMNAGAPKRSIVILAVTAEESGLLGSYYYALNPIYPLNKTVTALNIDTMNIYGRTKDVWVLGLGDSEIADFVYEAVEKKQKRDVTFFAHPEWGIEYRGDHFSFNRMGIPSIVVAGGYNTLDPTIDMDAKIADYDATKYHKLADEFTDELNFEGTADDVISMFLIGNDVANSSKFPNWHAGMEFKHLRDAYMKEIGR